MTMAGPPGSGSSAGSAGRTTKSPPFESRDLMLPVHAAVPWLVVGRVKDDAEAEGPDECHRESVQPVIGEVAENVLWGPVVLVEHDAQGDR